MAKEKQKLKTVDEIANSLVVSLTNVEEALNIFRRIGKYKFRKEIHLSDVELEAQLDKDTESFVRTQSEYETMFHFLEKRGLLEKYAEFRAEVHAAIQARISPEVKP
jgi:hypothetical protein